MNEILEKRPTTWLWVVLIVGTITSICFWLFPITIVLIVMLCKRIEFNNKITDEIRSTKRKQKNNPTLKNNNILIKDRSKEIIEFEEKIKISTYQLVKFFLPKWNKIWIYILNNMDEFKQYLSIKEVDNKSTIIIKNNLTTLQYLELITKLEKNPIWFFVYRKNDSKELKYLSYTNDQKQKYLDDYKKFNLNQLNIMVLDYKNMEQYKSKPDEFTESLKNRISEKFEKEYWF